LDISVELCRFLNIRLCLFWGDNFISRYHRVEIGKIVKNLELAQKQNSYQLEERIQENARSLRFTD